MYEITAMTTEEIPILALLIRQLILFLHLCVSFELFCVPAIKASLSKDWEDDWQDSVSDSSQSMRIGFILSLHISFWDLGRPVI